MGEVRRRPTVGSMEPIEPGNLATVAAELSAVVKQQLVKCRMDFTNNLLFNIVNYSI